MASGRPCIGSQETHTAVTMEEGAKSRRAGPTPLTGEKPKATLIPGLHKKAQILLPPSPILLLPKQKCFLPTLKSCPMRGWGRPHKPHKPVLVSGDLCPAVPQSSS